MGDILTVRVQRLLDELDVSMAAAGVSAVAAAAPAASRRGAGGRLSAPNGSAAAAHASDSGDYQPAGARRAVAATLDVSGAWL